MRYLKSPSSWINLWDISSEDQVERYSCYLIKEMGQSMRVADCIANFEESSLKEDHRVDKAEDPLIEIDIGDAGQRWQTYVSGLLDEEFKSRLVDLIIMCCISNNRTII